MYKKTKVYFNRLKKNKILVYENKMTNYYEMHIDSILCIYNVPGRLPILM